VRSLTAKTVQLLASEEGLVLEAYKDSAGIWTWALGVTDASGHKVGRYKDEPTTVERALDVSLWLLRERYLPPVLKAFDGHDLTEAQLAAALSFHWNTGAILTASWVKMFKTGEIAQARTAFLGYCKARINGVMQVVPALAARRKREAALFFDGVWPGDMKVTIWNVAKPSYQPRGGRPVDIGPALQQILGGS